MLLKFAVVFDNQEQMKRYYVESVNSSQVFNYAVQFFQSLNTNKRGMSGIRFSQFYNIQFNFKVDRLAENIDIQPHHSIIISREGALQFETDQEHPHYKAFVAGAKPELTFMEISEKLELPLEEIYLYTRHLLYYKRAILIEKLDNFSYFMLKSEFNAFSLILAEQKIYKDFAQPSNLGICTYLSLHKSWDEIKHKYISPTLDLQTLILMLCQLLTKNLVEEVQLYMRPMKIVITPGSPSATISPEAWNKPSSMISQAIEDAASRGLSVKAMLSEGRVTEKELSKELFFHKDNYECIYKFE